MARTTRLPEIEITDLGEGIGFELAAPAEALLQLADAFDEALRIEVTPDDGSILVVRLTDGPVTIRHEGTKIDIVGGRPELRKFAEWLHFVAAGPSVPSDVRYHAHLEHYPGHAWLAADSEPVVITLSD